MEFINIADLKDPNDPDGRSYRQVNATQSHKLPVGTLVELENGCRLFIAKHTRDCDMTPLYSLAPKLDSHECNLMLGWIHGYGEESLKAISVIINEKETP